MRIRRWLVVGPVLAVVIAVPGGASANGGAYIGLDRTHYLPGETAVAEAYVYIPERKQDVLERGPFYAFLVPNGIRLAEGKPIPDGVIRVGTFAVQEGRRDSFELEARLTVPDLPGDYYTVALCNDPCTLTGFGEPLSGTISVVETVREGDLLTENSKLTSRTFGLRRDVRKSERRLEELQAQLDLALSERSALAEDVTEIEGELAAARSREAPAGTGSSRPLIDGWAAGLAALAVLALALAIVRRRRIRPLAAP